MGTVGFSCINTCNKIPIIIIIGEMFRELCLMTFWGRATLIFIPYEKPIYFLEEGINTFTKVPNMRGW